MAKFSIKSPAGVTLYEGKPSYNGVYMSPASLTFRQICSPTPIAFSIGCYVDYSVIVNGQETRTGHRYYMFNAPQVKKQAGFGKVGDSFVYDSVIFYDVTKMLDFMPFRDYVKDDNHIHFSTRESFSTYEDVAGIAKRIQSCINEGQSQWNFVVEVASGEGVSPELAALMAETREFSVSNTTVLGALSRIYEVWPEVGWVYSIRSGSGSRQVHVITIGGAGLVGDAQTYLYGKGKGLKSIQRNAANDGEIVNRLYAYGNTTNMPPRYYNGKDIAYADSVDIPNLMIPIAEWGEDTVTEKPSAIKSYIEDSDSQDENGLREKYVYFDGRNDLEDIHPTIKGMTVKDLRDYISAGGTVDKAPGSAWADNQPLDEVQKVYADVGDKTVGFDNGLADDNGRAVTYLDSNGAGLDKTYSISPIPSSYSVLAWYDFDGNPAANNVILGIAFGGKIIIESSNAPIRSASLTIYYSYQSSGSYVSGEFVNDALAVSEDGSSATFSGNIETVSPYPISVVDAGFLRFYIQINVGFTQGSGNTTLTMKASGTADARFYSKVQQSFRMILPPFGYDLFGLAATEDRVRIAMTSGMCAGREFEVTASSFTWAPCDDDVTDKTNPLAVDVKRYFDESLSQYFPNTSYPIAANDKFVILGIAMPEVYITAAEARLLTAAEAYLESYAKELWQFTPEVDSKFMVENGRFILPAQYMVIIDTNLIEADVSALSYFKTTDGGYFLTDSEQKIIVNKSAFAVSILVDSVTVDESVSEIPSYKVVLRDRKRKR